MTGESNELFADKQGQVTQKNHSDEFLGIPESEDTLTVL
jgi:hypothetical protein